MKEIIHLALKTGYSFKETYGDVKNILDFENGNGAIGIADSASSFGFVALEKLLKGKDDIKPIYGARIAVVKDGTQHVPPRGQFGCEYIFIAKNIKGLREIYNLIKINYDNFYYRGQVSFSDVLALSENVIVIAEDVQCTDRLDYVAITTSTPKYMIEVAREENIPFVAIVNNEYSRQGDHDTYELLVGSRNANRHTYPQHIMSTEEIIAFHKKKGILSLDEIKIAIDNTHAIAGLVEKFKLPKAPLIESKSKFTIEYLCEIGAKKKGIDIKNKGIYRDRYEREILLIKEKSFDHYFLVVADMISKAKKKMLVGPGRGSAGGSLVCYLLGITDGIDPVEYGLMFERFIDVTRSDLPDIDIDFPDNKRDSVIKQLIVDYGEDHVKHIANVSTMQPKSAIGDFAKGLKFPISEVEELKNAIIENKGGFKRAGNFVSETLFNTDVGVAFCKKNPKIQLAINVEGHPSHTSVHAAGIIVCNDPIHWYIGTNIRDKTAMVDKFAAEYLNLLKIDVLGLRTLSILEECASMVGMKHSDYYLIEKDDKKTFDLLSDGRTHGVFQFEGSSLRTLSMKMGIENFNDMIAITSLARPGALYSGGASRYIELRLGEKTPVFYGEEHKKITEDTFGIVVYQEQMLNLCRIIGGLDWNLTNEIRKAMSKTLGKEYFERYRILFVEGAIKNGYTEVDSNFLWGEIEYAGNYAFNKSHAASYALVSYWTAYMKANHPLEFVVANLNNAKDVDSAIKILRDAVVHEGVEYTPLDPDKSKVYWSVADGKIVGGLINLKGIGLKKANEIIRMRDKERNWTPAIVKLLMDPVTDYDYLFPCEHFWGDIYARPEVYGLSQPPTLIKDIQGVKGDAFTFIGSMKSKNVRDLNEYINVEKRGGKLIVGDHHELIIKLEDDTDSLICTVDRFSFEEKGKYVAENGVIDDWYIVKALLTSDKNRYMKIMEITKLTEDMIEKQ